MSDELFAKLAELPVLDIDELGAARVRQRAHQVLERQRRGQPDQSRFKRRLLTLQTAVIGVVAASYLFWVVESVLAPYY